MGKLKHERLNSSAVQPASMAIDADVHELGGLLADDVHAQELHVVAAEDQLEEAGLVADDLAAGAVARTRRGRRRSRPPWP